MFQYNFEEFNVLISNNVQLCLSYTHSQWLHRVGLPDLTIPRLANLKLHLFGLE